MESSSEPVFPSLQPTDSHEVAEALAHAVTLWSSDPRESLRALRRAAESAADAGDDARSVALARAAADLRGLANLGASIPPAVLPLISFPTPVASGESPAVVESEENRTAALPVVSSDVGATQPGLGAPIESQAAPDTETSGAPGLVSAEAVAAQVAAAQEAAAELLDRPTPNAAHRAYNPVSLQQGSAGSDSETAQGVGNTVIGTGSGTGLHSQQVTEASTAPLFTTHAHDPGQTVPATPAAAAAAALQTASSQALSAGGDGRTPLSGYAAVGSSPVVMPNNPISGWSVGVHAGSHAASQPTPVEVPAARRPTLDTMRRPSNPSPSILGNGSLTARGYEARGYESPRGYEAPRSDVGGAGALIEHRTLRVAVNQAASAHGNFELHVLRVGESVPPGWRECLLLPVDPAQSAVPIA